MPESTDTNSGVHPHLLAQEIHIRQRFAQIARDAGANGDVSVSDFKALLGYALDRGLVTVKVIAERCGISKGAVSKWRNTDASPSSPAGRQVVIDRIVEHVRKETGALKDSMPQYQR